MHIFTKAYKIQLANLLLTSLAVSLPN